MKIATNICGETALAREAFTRVVGVIAQSVPKPKCSMGQSVVADQCAKSLKV
jgi:hypothetical protein